jgi:hypothetical protein
MNEHNSFIHSSLCPGRPTLARSLLLATHSGK